MPQLNPEFFLSQVFWLVITFSFLLIFLWKITLPRISLVLERREKKINDDIHTAKKLQTEAEEIQTKIDQQLFAIREQVAESIKETTIRLQNNISIGYSLKIRLAQMVTRSSHKGCKGKNSRSKKVIRNIEKESRRTLTRNKANTNRYPS